MMKCSAQLTFLLIFMETVSSPRKFVLVYQIFNKYFLRNEYFLKGKRSNSSRWYKWVSGATGSKHIVHQASCKENIQINILIFDIVRLFQDIDSIGKNCILRHPSWFRQWTTRVICLDISSICNWTSYSQVCWMDSFAEVEFLFRSKFARWGSRPSRWPTEQ